MAPEAPKGSIGRIPAEGEDKKKKERKQENK
jgi:hypothetical protein